MTINKISKIIFGFIIFLQFLSFSNHNKGKEFPISNIINLEGKPIALDDLKGNSKTIIDFWFIGCKPCISEMQKFPSILESNKELKIVSISVDSYVLWKSVVKNEQDSIDNIKVRNYAKMNGVEDIIKNDVRNWIHFNYEDPNSNGWPEIKELEINSYPTYLLLDEQANIKKQSHNINQLLCL